MIRVVHVEHYRRREGEIILARAVLDRASQDFLGRIPMSYRREDGKRVHNGARLAAARRRVDAGRFLLQRDDPVTWLWFSLAGFSLSAWHRRNHKLKHRLDRCERILALCTQKAYKRRSPSDLRDFTACVMIPSSISQ